jgi:hypothetical protein
MSTAQYFSYIATNIISFAATVVFAIYALRKSAKINNMSNRVMVQVGVIYLAFPFVNIAGEIEVYPAWMVITYVIFNYFECILLFYFPWLFIVSVVLIELHMQKKRHLKASE